MEKRIGGTGGSRSAKGLWKRFRLFNKIDGTLQVVPIDFVEEPEKGSITWPNGHFMVQFTVIFSWKGGTYGFNESVKLSFPALNGEVCRAIGSGL